MTRRLTALPLLALVALVTGCVGIEGDRAEQVDLLSKKVEITTYICPENSQEINARDDRGWNEVPPGEEDGCVGTDRSGFGSDMDQLLIAYRVPEDTSAPDEVVASTRTSPDPNEDLGRTNVTFRRSSDYERELEERDDDGEVLEDYDKRNTKWIGYVSEVLPADNAGEVRVRTVFEASTYGAFEHLTVVGGRGVDDSTRDARKRHDRLLRERGLTRDDLDLPRGGSSGFGPDRPVDCDESENMGPITVSVTECHTDPDVPNPSITYLRDLQVTGGEATGTAGSTVTVPFTLLTTGSPVATHAISLTATTPLGAVATPQWLTTDLPGGEAVRPVDVHIPAGTAPGTYPVTLTATHGPQSREGVGHVVVQAPATVAGSMSTAPKAKAKAKTARKARKAARSKAAARKRS